MATLNLNEKKIPSAENLRLLSSLILSLSSKQGAIENKLINNWVASTAYIKDESFVIYDELLYVCKISNADDTFDKNKWTCLSPVISELTKADIEALINLTPEQITNLQSLIDDTSISTTHTNSSSHIYMAIQDAIAECKDDTLKQIAKKVSGSYKIANTTADIVSADYIYLLSNGSNYDLYVLVDGTATKVGDTNIDLSEYVKTTDLADYMKTSDADGKFATIATVDGKIDKTSIATTLDNSATDDQVYSAKAINAELDGVVKKTDISTTINSTSTDDTIPSSKAVYDNTLGEAINSADKYGSDILYFPCGIYRITSDVLASSFVNLPEAYAGVLYVTSIYPNNTLDKTYSYRTFRYETHLGNNYYRSMYTDSVAGVIVYDTGWKRLCTTSVADVPRTVIVSENPNIILNSSCVYEVINGICYVALWGFQSSITGQYVICNSMPKTKFTMQGNCCYGSSGDTGASIFITNDGINNTRLFTEIHVIDQQLYGSFSYPVAES